MFVRIDQRAERRWTLEPRIETESNLGQHVEIGTEAGADNQPIRHQRPLLSVVRPGDLHCAASRSDGTDAIRSHDLETARFVRALRALSQLASRLELVRRPTTPYAVEIVASHDPGDARRRRLFGQRQQVEDHVERRVAAANDDDTLAGVAIAIVSKHVGNAVRDAVPQLPLARRGHTARPGRVGTRPSAAGVDHRTRLERLAGRQSHLERLRVAAPGAHLVEVLAADRGHAGVVADVRHQRGMARQRRQVLRDQLAAGRQRCGIGRTPADFLEQLFARGVDHVAPWRERADMRPLPHRRTGVRAGFEDHERLVVARQVSCCSQAHWSCSNNRDG